MGGPHLVVIVLSSTWLVKANEVGLTLCSRAAIVNLPHSATL